MPIELSYPYISDVNKLARARLKPLPSATKIPLTAWTNSFSCSLLTHTHACIQHRDSGARVQREPPCTSRVCRRALSISDVTLSYTQRALFPSIKDALEGSADRLAAAAPLPRIKLITLHRSVHALPRLAARRGPRARDVPATIISL